MGFGVRINGVGFSFILLTFFVLCSATDESHIFFSSHDMLAEKRHKILSAIESALGMRDIENMDPDIWAKAFVEHYYTNGGDTLVTAFVEHYYTTFDTNRGNLQNLYGEDSTLTFEGQKIRGASNVVAKLTSLPFQRCYHSVSTVDWQPSGVNDGLLVFVTGSIQLPLQQQQHLKFSQVFHLVSTSQGGFYVMTDMFRINYA
ncbi:nuclear transport factor 2B-like [Cajanus cajan]|uniref:nuclear transport factor 2B-like n=1 Tax=Cajanus cajan TaxID=3821 RepID=UPI00098D9EF1|nr:nuclear transport factor 2B-like [Cajanus cajan]